MNPIYRPGTFADTRTSYDVLVQAFGDFTQRMRMQGADMWTDQEFVSKFWERRKPLFEDLSSRADQFWVSENEGQIIGYTRSILQDGVRELTECFVVPRCQSAGVGHELLARAFPAHGARRRPLWQRLTRARRSSISRVASILALPSIPFLANRAR